MGSRTAEMYEYLHDQWPDAGTEAPGLRMEGAGAPGRAVARIWAPKGCRLDPSPHAERGPGAHLLLVVEGGGRVHQEGRVLEARRNHVVILDAELETRIDFPRPSVTYAWSLGGSVLGSRWIRERLGEVLPVREAIWSPARGLTNGLLDGDPALTDQPAIARAGEALLKAVVESSAPWTRRGADQVYGEAMALIEDRYGDPAFSAGQLARELLVSERTVARAFSFLGRTAREELDRRRAGALRLRTGLRLQASSEFAREAEEAGFTSVEAAERALRRLADGR